jgi:glycerol-3-phosphate dehydrogenase (NAD(P)+)
MGNLKNFGVYGGGSWGSALACAISRSIPNSECLLYARDIQVVEEINGLRTNRKYLGDTLIPKNVVSTSHRYDLASRDVIIFAVPSNILIQELRFLAAGGISRATVILIATKGLVENLVGEAELFSKVIKEFLPNKIGFISGPNFAREFAAGILSSITIASEHQETAKEVAGIIESDNIATSYTDDIITVQIAGAMKNVIAVKSGIYEAIGYQNNAKAGLISSGLEEIKLLSCALGGNQNSLTLPAVVGDLVLTCYSRESRNTEFGYKFHLNGYKAEFLKNYPILVEGMKAAGLLNKLSLSHGLRLPIVSSVAELIKN